MGIFDMFKRHKDDNAGGSGTALKDRVTGMMSGHGDQVGQGLDKAGQVIDDKTGHKYSNQINTGIGKAKDMFRDKPPEGSGEPGNAATDMPRPEQGAQGGDPAQPPQPPQS